MSLFPTDEDKAYQRGYARGKEEGVAAENKRVLEILDKFYDNIKVAHRHDTSNYSEGLLDGIDLSITEIKNGDPK